MCSGNGKFCSIIICMCIARKGHPWNDQYCVWQDVKPYSLTHSLTVYSGDGSLLWDIHNVGRRVREAAGSAERDCQEEERGYEASMESEPNSQETTGTTRPDEKVSSSY